MKKLLFASIMASSLCTFSAMADDMTGYISDSHCGAAHDKVSEANTKCVNKCLGGGSDPVLVSDGKVMKFDAASKDKAKAFAGQSVKIDGTMDGGMVKINSINKAE